MSFLLRFKPPRIAWALIGIGIISHLALFRTFKISLFYLVVGGLVILSGFLIMIWAWWLFKKQHVGICPTSPSSLLITSGVFRFSRNPMYLGILMMMFGLAVSLQSISLGLVGVVFFIVMQTIFIPYEEKKLEKDIGEAFIRYKMNVRKWL